MPNPAESTMHESYHVDFEENECGERVAVMVPNPECPYCQEGTCTVGRKGEGTMAEHTPGPWVTATEYGEQLRVLGRQRSGDGLFHVALCNTEADAQLIAAAPELLAALERIVGGYDWDSDAIDQARAAIQKARES